MTACNHVYIVAEAGVNHNGSLQLALQLIDAAVKAGADAVKFQTYKAEKMTSKTAPKADYQRKTKDLQETQLDMLKKLELSVENTKILFNYCRDKGIEFFSTPFDGESVNLLANSLRVRRIKISSGDLTNAPLLLKIAQTQKPAILSTGMGTLSEIEQALGVLAFGYMGGSIPTMEAFQQAYCSSAGQMILRDKVLLLHCTTEYPTPFADVNLKTLDTLQQAFGLSVGYSDHTAGIAISIAAAARGAVMIEKHLTIDRALPGPDHHASLMPDEFTCMVNSIREVQEALGSSIKMPVPSEFSNRMIARKSIHAAARIAEGETFTEKNLIVKRPGTGISPIHYWSLLGEKAKRHYKEEELVE